jgi:hypothetical protein
MTFFVIVSIFDKTTAKIGASEPRSGQKLGENTHGNSLGDVNFAWNTSR